MKKQLFLLLSLCVIASQSFTGDDQALVSSGTFNPQCRDDSQGFIKNTGYISAGIGGTVGFAGMAYYLKNNPAAVSTPLKQALSYTAAGVGGSLLGIMGANIARKYTPETQTMCINGITSAFNTIKSDLTIDKPDKQAITTDQSDWSKKFFKGCRVTAYCYTASYCARMLLSNYFPITPGARQFDHLPSWSTSCILGPMAEELAFTYIPSKLFGDYAQIIIPGLFGACHVKHLQDKNFAIHVFTHTVLTSFINHRVVRRDPESELPVTIMRHMLNNQIMYLYQTSRN